MPLDPSASERGERAHASGARRQGRPKSAQRGAEGRSPMEKIQPPSPEDRPSEIRLSAAVLSHNWRRNMSRHFRMSNCVGAFWRASGLALCLLVAAGQPSFAQTATAIGRETTAASVAKYALSADMPVDPEVLIGALPNGLRFYIRPNPKPARQAELRLVVKAGSVLEDDDQRGLAHFVEHM